MQNSVGRNVKSPEYTPAANIPSRSTRACRFEIATRLITRYNDCMDEARRYPRVPQEQTPPTALAVRLLARAVWLIAITVSVFAIGLVGARLVVNPLVEGIPDTRVKILLLDVVIAMSHPGAVLLSSVVAVILVDWACRRLVRHEPPTPRSTPPKSPGTKPARPASQTVKVKANGGV
jgi:hypothetical protein